MVSPWEGPRHRSWASNTVLTLIALVALLAGTVATDYFGEPPTYLVALLGTSAGAFFTALGSDKNKRDTEVSETAHRAETKADTANRRVSAEVHRNDDMERRADDSEDRADASEDRETGWSQHRDHSRCDDGGGV